MWMQVLFLLEGILEQLGVFPPVFVDDMGVYIRDHVDLGVSGVSLYGFDVATVYFQFAGDAGVAQAVEVDLWEIVLFDQLFLHLVLRNGCVFTGITLHHFPFDGLPETAPEDLVYIPDHAGTDIFICTMTKDQIDNCGCRQQSLVVLFNIIVDYRHVLFVSGD